MSDSATLGHRERRMRKTASDLTSVCRRLTAAHGLAGFTIEDVCAEVDVSRRTFFNYFATKEDAVIGANPDDDFDLLAAEFFSRGAGGWAKVIDDLVGLVIVHFESDEHSAAMHSDFLACLEREPRLLSRFIGVSRLRERQLVAMIAKREAAADDDPHAIATVSLLSTLLLSTSERFVDPANTRTFSDILTTSLAAFRTVLAPPPPASPPLERQHP